jgi:membrane complex biogenesis BtpA family protein
MAIRKNYYLNWRLTVRNFETLGKKKAVIGLIHLYPMPGTPFYEEGNFERSLEKAVNDSKRLYEGGADGCLIQTVDKVYPAEDEADYARAAAMAAITHAVSQSTGEDFQIGVQLMWNSLHASLAIAKVCGGSFMRCTALVGATMSPFGLVEADPLSFLNYRAALNAQNIKLVAEIEGMHFHWFGEEKPIGQVARSAAMVGANAVEIAIQDEEKSNQAIQEIKAAVPSMPIILGGYTNHENVARRMKDADGAFVGTCLEKQGWGGEIDVDRVKQYVEIVRNLEK